MPSLTDSLRAGLDALQPIVVLLLLLTTFDFYSRDDDASKEMPFCLDAAKRSIRSFASGFSLLPFVCLCVVGSLFSCAFVRARVV